MEAAWANDASSSSASSFSSSSISTQFKYDVFLSFSGVDTRNNFTSHLLHALERHGFDTFRDDTKLNRGEYISDALLKAIEESRISLIVLSKNYAASRWCLDELVKIMECKKTLQQIVLPIFYNVEPSDVRVQKGSLAEAFAKHEERHKKSSDGRVKKWREVLTEVANLSGWDLPKVANGDEAHLIRIAVEEVQNQLDADHLHVASYEIGLESRIQKLKLLLKMESTDVRIVAVWGMGGIGKTTVVKKLYNLIQHKFDGSCFLANIREISKQPDGLVVLQEQLLSDILRTGTNNVRNFHQGIEVIKRRAFRRKVLLILDDVDDVGQLKALAIDRDSFGFGSTIIITTRDISLLNFLKVDERYVVQELNEYESLELFKRHCFDEDHPSKDHLELSRQVVRYAGGLPLALEILGSFFRGKSIPQWKIAIVQLGKIPDNKIQGILKISFDSLSIEVQELFLDVACFFDGTSRDFTVKILDGRHYDAESGIRVLVDRCLIKFDSCNKLEMHDMVRGMGREIVRQECFDDPGKRSRLWYFEDVLEVLRYGTGTELVRGLVLNTTDDQDQVNAKPLEMMDKLWYYENVLVVRRESMGMEAVEGRLAKDVQVNANAFDKMKNLWLLHLDYIYVDADFEHTSERLLWLSWKGFPLEFAPQNLSMEKLIALDLRYSSLIKVWKGYKIMEKLKFLYLSHCRYLTRTPDFSGLRSLEELLLNDCESLVEVDESIRCLNKLLVLDLKNCTKLWKLPSGIWMLESLECLDLSGCSKLGNLAEFKGSLNKLRWWLFSSWTLPPKDVNSIGFSLTFVQTFSCITELNLENCSLSYLPDQIGNIISLKTLNLRRNNMSTLPDCIWNLTCLKHLDLGFNNVSHLPSEIGRLISLETWIIERNSLSTLPDSIGNLSCLKFLDVNENKLSHFPSEIRGFTSLESLNLGNCNLSYLPNEIGRLVSLKTLELRGNGFHTVPESICDLVCLKDFRSDSCNLSHLPSEFGSLISLKYLRLGCKSLLTLPDSIFTLTRLKNLDLDGCNLFHLPSEIGNLVSLITLSLRGNDICTLPDSISNLHHLKRIFLDNCAKLQSLPKLPACLVSALGCASLESIPLEFDQLGLAMVCTGCNKLAENNYANCLLKQAHKSKGLSKLQKVVDILVPIVGDIPILFPYQGTGSYISFVVPPFEEKKMLGWIICLFLTGPGDEYSSCRLFIDKMIYNKIEKEPVYRRYKHIESTCQDQVWLMYSPQGYSGLQLKGGDEVEISILPTPELMVKNWGVDLIYEVDENITKTNENQETLIQYTSSPCQDLILQEDVGLALKLMLCIFIFFFGPSIMFVFWASYFILLLGSFVM